MAEIFKTYIHTSTDEDMADLMLPISKKILDQIETNEDYKNGKSSYFYPEVIKNYVNDLRPFYNHIRKNVLEYLNNQNFDIENLSVNINALWISEMNKGGEHKPHSHVPSSQISGNFYVQVDENSGHLRFYRQEFHSNVFYNLKVKEFNEFNSSFNTFIPEKGLMCIWRSDLVHGVDYNESDSRIAVSFNATVDYL